MTTFHVKINDRAEHKVTVASSYYFVGALAALSLLGNEDFDANPVIRLEVWIPDLVEEYGPYFYEAVRGEVPEQITLNPVVKVS